MFDDSLKQYVKKKNTHVIPFDRLMSRRVLNILLVSSLYDSFTFEEDGRLSEMLLSDYLELNLRYAPHVDRVSTAHKALAKLESKRYDMVISMLRLGDMNPLEFGRAARSIQPGIQIMLLSFSIRELAMLESLEDASVLERVFMWRGDVRLFLAMIKSAEDKLNAWHDARLAGVQTLILVEDSVRFYSSYLPMLYTEIMEQTRALMSDGANRMQRLLRMHARPKVLLATNYEEAFSFYSKYQEHLLGVIVDAGFPRNGELDPRAGHDFASMVAREYPDCAILIQSSDEDSKEFANSINASFINKRSPSLMHDLREFMKGHLGFGDFVFRMPDGTVVTSASDLGSLVEALKVIPDESLIHHGRRKDFSTWLMARTEFEIAKAIRIKKMSSFACPSDFRAHLISVLKFYRSRSRDGIVSDFSCDAVEAGSHLVRIGTGSLGGKGRGLAFFNALLNDYEIENHINGVQISMPATSVISTSVFDQLMDSLYLTELVLGEATDEEIRDAFLSAKLPDDVLEALRTFISRVHYPLAVRSSSLLEDASYQPFAGVYKTYMIPNSHDDTNERLRQLTMAIKLVYASTFYKEAREYLEATPNRLEEEKMAVVVQEVVGRRHDQYLYPDMAGVARSYNFYPVADTQARDGVVCAVLGLGRTVAEGGRCARFSPQNTCAIFEAMSPRDFVSTAQRSLWALDMERLEKGSMDVSDFHEDLVQLDLNTALDHGMLKKTGSVYNPANRTIEHGVDKPGVKLITMAGLLQDEDLKIGEALKFILSVGQDAFSWPVEVEFAANLPEKPGEPAELIFLQMRPMIVATSGTDIGDISREKAICISEQSMGPGQIESVQDLVYVRADNFDRVLTGDIAEEVGKLNERMKKNDRLYILIGPGRWGSMDQWLGIPVTWGQISNVRCLVETEMDGLKVNPSQGSHFFHNVTAFGVGCLSINFAKDGGFLDMEWLDSQPAEFETEHLRHLHFDNPIQIYIDGQSGRGVIIKPAELSQNPPLTWHPKA